MQIRKEKDMKYECQEVKSTKAVTYITCVKL